MLSRHSSRFSTAKQEIESNWTSYKFCMPLLGKMTFLPVGNPHLYQVSNRYKPSSTNMVKHLYQARYPVQMTRRSLGPVQMCPPPSDRYKCNSLTFVLIGANTRHGLNYRLIQVGIPRIPQYRSDTVAVPTGIQTGGIQNLKFKKIAIKIRKNNSRFIESNGVKSFQIWLHSLFFVGLGSSIEKEEKPRGPLAPRSNTGMQRPPRHTTQSLPSPIHDLSPSVRRRTPPFCRLSRFRSRSAVYRSECSANRGGTESDADRSVGEVSRGRRAVFRPGRAL
jgi:hypothetical protein